jgi:transcriptional regulator with XRE-family HTH domain
MPRNVRTHLTGDSPQDPALLPKHLTKQEFGKRLYTLMLEKGWRQSELARRASLPRDSISVYMRGKSLPTPHSVKLLSSALGVTPQELLPNHTESAIDNDAPAMEFKVSPNLPGKAWLRINRLVSVTAALNVMKILEDVDAVDRSGSGHAA